MCELDQPYERTLRSVIVSSILGGPGRLLAKGKEDFDTIRYPSEKGCHQLGRTQRQWGREFVGYLDTGGASNGGPEAVNGRLEHLRGIALGFRNLDNYRLRMLLIGGGLTHPHLR